MAYIAPNKTTCYKRLIHFEARRNEVSLEANFGLKIPITTTNGCDLELYDYVYRVHPGDA